MSRCKTSPYVLFSSLVAALGSFLFGYQTSIISGAILYIQDEFVLTAFDQGFLVSIILLGCILGALCGGFLSDQLGRRKSLFLTAILFFLSTYVLYEADSWSSLLIGRFIGGIAVGIVSVAVPLYIAEISPPESRGALVSLNQLLITIGILVSYLVAYAFADDADWRDMFAIAIVPIALQFIGLFFVPETPAWLISHDKTHAADKVLSRLGLTSEKEELLHELGKHQAQPKQSMKTLFSPEIRLAFLVGVGMSVFQQITGINTVIYYSPSVFEAAGFFTSESAILETVWIGVVNVFMTFVGLWLVDKAGRRSLALVGLTGMAFSLAVLSIALHGKSDAMAVLSVISIMFYIAFFAIGLGIVTWLIISEIFPLGVRGRAMGIATLANWACNYGVSLSFLPLINAIGTDGVYWLYAFICLLGIWFVVKKVPETRGKTFEEIQHFWKTK